MPYRGATGALVPPWRRQFLSYHRAAQTGREATRTVANDNGETALDGQFISLWCLFIRIGKAEKSLEHEAAGYVMSCLDSDPTGMNYLRRRDASSGLVLPMDMGARLHIVRLLGMFASQGALLDADDRPNDDAQPTFESVGCYQSDILPFLAQHDVAVWLDDEAGKAALPDGRRIPGWMLAYADRAWISRSRAAKLLLAVTDKADLLSPQYESALDQWGEVLSDAISRGEIVAANKGGSTQLSHADLCAWAQKQGYSWPFAAPKPAGAKSVPPAAPEPKAVVANSSPHEDARTVKHTLRTRSDGLSAVIAKAKALALDGNDPNAVWAALVKLAQDVNRPPPLLGYVDGEGVKWDQSGTIVIQSNKAFRARWARAKSR